MHYHKYTVFEDGDLIKIFSFCRMDGIRTLDLLQLLQDRFVILTGGRDRRGGPLLSFPSTPRRERVKPEDIKRVLSYLFSIPR